MNDDTCQCICAGHVCLDIIPEFPAREGATLGELLKPGSLLIIGRARLAPGGPVPNVGLALHTLGVRTAFMGKIGDDLFGQGLLRMFEPYGADRGMNVVPGEVTSYTVVIAPPGIDRIFLHNPGANDTYGVADVDFTRTGGAALFHLGYPPLMRRLYADGGDELSAIYRNAKVAGLTTSLDMAFPDPASPAGKANWRGILGKTLPAVDIFVPSCEELMFMLDRDRFARLREAAGGRDPVLGYTGDDLRFLGAEALRLGAGVVLIKAGQRGMYLATASEERLRAFGRAPAAAASFARRELWHGAYRVASIASANGSGDNAIAGFLTAFLRGSVPEECLHVGCAVGADNLAVLDATSGVRPWDETIAAIPTREQCDPEAGAGFAFDAGSGVWRGSLDGRGVSGSR
jgi:sugar/nucleoside kinase (ribokinase family)